MDWPGAGNWQGSFADSKLAVAAYLNDDALYADAKARRRAVELPRRLRWQQGQACAQR
jgi:hypothetical protein